MQPGSENSAINKKPADVCDPKFNWRDILHQIYLDLVDKEVQSAATYSYLWLADQAGHVCIGIVCHFIIYFLLSFVISSIIPATYSGGEITHITIGIVTLCICCIIFVLFELKAYSSVKKRATGLFPLNRRGLKLNALTATFYLGLGAFVGLSFQLALIGLGFRAFGEPIQANMPLFLFGICLFLFALLNFIWPIRFWLTQKIIWQKAGLPYLYRLANMPHTLLQDDADTIYEILDQPAPPHSPARQIVIHGPPDSGRTQLAAGIGTEFAFRGRKVRYLTFEKFKELLENNTQYSGPRNINYWPWEKSQILIIDDVTPYADEERKYDETMHQFTSQLKNHHRPNLTPLSHCHTVWILGNNKHEKWMEKIMEICRGSDPHVFHLSTNATIQPMVVDLRPESPDTHPKERH